MDPDLICPDCGSRIGNARRSCRRCNRFAQAVNRRVAKALADLDPQATRDLRHQVERDVYRSTVLEAA